MINNDTFTQSQQKLESMWQNLVTAQLAQVEAMLQRVDTTLKAQLSKSKEQVEEMSRLTASAITWAGELQAGAVELALSTLKNVHGAMNSGKSAPKAEA